MSIWVTIALVVVAVLGWLLGRTSLVQRKKNKKENLPKDYFIGLNYLLNEQPDRAVDVFIQLLEVDEQTVETHLALGSLFRRRGEVERAIRIHQNLMNRPSLSKTLRVQALLELGRDYLSAGVLDRAERLLQEALETSGAHRIICLRHLQDIYEREKDWLAALEVVEQLQQQTSQNMGPIIAQYYCELIDDPRHHLTPEEIEDCLRKANQADKHCVRAGLLMAQQELNRGNAKETVKIYKRLLKQDPAFAPMLLPMLDAAFTQNDDAAAYLDYLYKTLESRPDQSVVLSLADKLKQWHGLVAAKEFLVKQLEQNAALSSIDYLLDVEKQLLPTEVRDGIAQVRTFLQKNLQQFPRYRCEHCGFSSKKLHWLCPSCRRWGVIKPTQVGEQDK